MQDSTSWKPEQLDPESDQIREVYARYGAAMYFAQVLEHGIANYLVALQLGTGMSRDEADALWDELFALPMGQQLRRAFQAGSLDDRQIERLQAALKMRNFLAHDYFRERADRMFTVRGRNGMLDELEEMRAQLESADHELEPTTRAILARYGITEEVIEVERSRLLREQANAE